MRSFPARLAASLSAPSSGLLPPLRIYARVLRAHRRRLDPAMRALGDGYVKAEFRRHADAFRETVERGEEVNPVHAIGFLTEWQKYAEQIEGESWRGQRLDEAKIGKMSGEQLAQLYELMKAARESG